MAADQTNLAELTRDDFGMGGSPSDCSKNSDSYCEPAISSVDVSCRTRITGAFSAASAFARTLSKAMRPVATPGEAVKAVATTGTLLAKRVNQLEVLRMMHEQAMSRLRARRSQYVVIRVLISVSSDRRHSSLTVLEFSYLAGGRRSVIYDNCGTCRKSD
jgi:hypothetical protein